MSRSEERRSGVASSLTPQSQVLLIDPYPRCLPLHSTLNLHEIIVNILEGQNNARHPKGGTEDSIEDSDEEGFQDGDGITPSSKAVLLVSQKEGRKLKDIQCTEEVLIDADGRRKEQDPLKENYLILNHPSHADFCNDTECEGNEKVPNIHEGSA